MKGRDWYDFEWYIRHGISLDFKHLQERILQFNGELMSQDDFMQVLRQRLLSTNINMVKADVEDFIIDKRELDIWSNDYFLQLAEMMTFT